MENFRITYPNCYNVKVVRYVKEFITIKSNNKIYTYI